MIDNRHTIDRLELLEEQTLESNEKAIEDEQPISFADIFPLSAGSSSKRGESPERKFVVSFKSCASRSELGDEEAQDLHRVSSGKSRQDESLRAVASSSEHDSDGPDLPNLATSRLVLDIIPHREADEKLGSAQNVTGSVLLEAKAEETVDTLMRQWTYINPKYFTDDDQSSLSSAENVSSFPLNPNNYQSSARERCDARRKKSSRLNPCRGRKPYPVKGHRPTREFTKSSSPEYDEEYDRVSSLTGERSQDTGKQSNGLPTTQWATGRHRAPIDSGYQTAQTPTSPAPPYGHVNPLRCPNCPPVTPPGPGMAAIPHDSISADTSKAAKKGWNYSADRAWEVVERLSELLNKTSLHDEIIQNERDQVGDFLRSKTSASHAPQREYVIPSDQQHQQDSANRNLESKPVTLKDCLGRTFVFPIETCKKWHVSLQPCTNSLKKKH